MSSKVSPPASAPAQEVCSTTVAIWGDAICAALVGDTRELVEMLRAPNEITPDVAEFVAWLIECKTGRRSGGRPPVPEKFRSLDRMARRPGLYDAVMEYRIEKANWRYCHRTPFPREQKLAEIAKRNNVDASTLHEKLKRSVKSGKRL